MSTPISLATILAQAKDDELFLLPAGEHELDVLSCKPRETDIMPTFRVVSGPYAGKKVMIGALSWNGNGSGIFYRNMLGFGLTEQFLASPEISAKDISQALVGRRVVVTLTQEAWNQQMRNKLVPGAVRLVSAPPGSGTPQGQPTGLPTATATPNPVTTAPDPAAVAAAAAAAAAAQAAAATAPTLDPAAAAAAAAQAAAAAVPPPTPPTADPNLAAQAPVAAAEPNF